MNDTYSSVQCVQAAMSLASVLEMLVEDWHAVCSLSHIYESMNGHTQFMTMLLKHACMRKNTTCSVDSYIYDGKDKELR